MEKRWNVDDREVFDKGRKRKGDVEGEWDEKER